MRITEIRTKKLFGLFDHTVALNLDQRITIIYGLNGVGKTTILRLVAGLFSARYSALAQIPFEEFVVAFDNGNELKVEKRFVETLSEGVPSSREVIVLTYPPFPPFEISSALG